MNDRMHELAADIDLSEEIAMIRKTDADARDARKRRERGYELVRRARDAVELTSLSDEEAVARRWFPHPVTRPAQNLQAVAKIVPAVRGESVRMGLFPQTGAAAITGIYGPDDMPQKQSFWSHVWSQIRAGMKGVWR